MPKVLIKEGITVVRDKKRIRPTIGELFDLTADEIADLDRVRAGKAYEKPQEHKVDKRSKPTADDDGGQGKQANPTDPTDPTDPPGDDLTDMSQKDLVKIATDMGLTFKGNASKDTLIGLIEAARKENDDL